MILTYPHSTKLSRFGKAAFADVGPHRKQRYPAILTSMSRSYPSLWQRLCTVFVLNSRPELKELFSFSLLFSFAFALIIIFEPVFFYQQGFSLAHIAGYYALHYLTYIVAFP